MSGKFERAVAKLHAFAEHLPQSEIEEKYIALYHSLLADMEKETGEDLASFQIPEEEVQNRLTGGYHDADHGWLDVYSEHALCDREMS